MSIRNERGQVIPFVAVAAVAIVGLLALVVDVGGWFRDQRQLQATVDAAVLAGARDLPSTAEASASATAYLLQNASQNRLSLSSSTVTFPSGGACADTSCVAVRASLPASGVFTRALSSVFNTITVSAHAQAIIFPPSLLKNVSPAGIKTTDACAATSTGCFNVTKTLDFNVSTDFALLNLDCHSAGGGGPVSGCGPLTPGTMNGYIVSGDPSALPVNAWYASNNGVKNGVKNGFDDATGTTLLVPLFDAHDNATDSYHVVAWAAFHLTTVVKWTSSAHQLQGYFTTRVVSSLPPGTGSGGGANFGVYGIAING